MPSFSKAAEMPSFYFVCFLDAEVAVKGVAVTELFLKTLGGKKTIKHLDVISK